MQQLVRACFSFTTCLISKRFEKKSLVSVVFVVVAKELTEKAALLYLSSAPIELEDILARFNVGITSPPCLYITCLKYKNVKFSVQVKTIYLAKMPEVILLISSK